MIMLALSKASKLNYMSIPLVVKYKSVTVDHHLYGHDQRTSVHSEAQIGTEQVIL